MRAQDPLPFSYCMEVSEHARHTSTTQPMRRANVMVIEPVVITFRLQLLLRQLPAENTK